MSDEHTDPLAKWAYANGADPIERSVWLIGIHLDVATSIIESREINPNSFPIYRLPLTRDAVLRRIVGALMDAGWQPPSAHKIPDSVAGIHPPEAPDA